MNINEASEVNWTEKVDSSSSVRDPLGLWNHLNIQIDYVPGITSVTNRIRYYSLLAWYYEKLLDQRTVTTKDFERLFILTCLSHHNGDYNHSALGHVFNKQRFKNTWNSTNSFKLDFTINGFGRTYYNRQLDVLRCCWTDILNDTHRSPINNELTSSFPEIDNNFFRKNEYTKEEITHSLSKLCICQRYDKEIDVMSKILFGFIVKKENDWYVDEESYNRFIQNMEIDFNFKGNELNTEEEIISNQEVYQEYSQRRRNTLFMFLKIISETKPTQANYKKVIFDALYFGQNTQTHNQIDFRSLKKIVNYWQLFQLNVYYVYAIEKVFDVVQELIYDETGVNKKNILKSLDKKLVHDNISKLLGVTITENTEIKDIQKALYEHSKSEEGIKAPLNESTLYDRIHDSDELEEIVACSLLVILLLKRKVGTISSEIIASARIDKDILIEDKLKLSNLFSFIDSHLDKNILFLMDFLLQSVIERHLYESAIRMSWGTKNWLFVEEDDRLFFSKTDRIYIHTRDNRWESMLSLMQDIEMVKITTNITLTEKGEKWLQQAKLI